MKSCKETVAIHHIFAVTYVIIASVFCVSRVWLCTHSYGGTVLFTPSIPCVSTSFTYVLTLSWAPNTCRSFCVWWYLKMYVYACVNKPCFPCPFDTNELTRSSEISFSWCRSILFNSWILMFGMSCCVKCAAKATLGLQSSMNFMTKIPQSQLCSKKHDIKNWKHMLRNKHINLRKVMQNHI